MSSNASLRKDFEDYVNRVPFRPSPEITEAGLVLGYGVVLARLARNRRGERMLAVDLDEERLLALVSAVAGRQISPNVIRHVRRASEQLRRGELCLAQIELAFAQFPSLKSQEDAFRLFLAEDLLTNGFTPHRLIKELGFDPRLLKYDPDEHRISAGNGKGSGEWSKGNGPDRGGKQTGNKSKPRDALTVPTAVAGAAVAASPQAGTLASGLFATGDASAFVTGIGLLAAGISGAMLGMLIVPFDSHKVVEGTVPGDADLNYRFTHAQPTLTFWRQGSSPENPEFVARLVGDIFYEGETGVPIARLVGDKVIFDAESLASVPALGRSDAKAQTRAEEATEQPQLCPDPGPDVPHGASLRSIEYQAYISFLNNPKRPLAPGYAVSLRDPKTGRRVVYDDCREIDGVLIEAKGPGFAKLLRSKYMQDVLTGRWINQGTRQVRAAGWHSNEWFFAEPEACDFAEKVFRKAGLDRIWTRYQPPLIDKPSEEKK